MFSESGKVLGERGSQGLFPASLGLVPRAQRSAGAALDGARPRWRITLTDAEPSRTLGPRHKGEEGWEICYLERVQTAISAAASRRPSLASTL